MVGEEIQATEECDDDGEEDEEVFDDEDMPVYDEIDVESDDSSYDSD